MKWLFHISCLLIPALSFASNELREDQVFIIDQTAATISTTTYSQAIQLERGWNLVSFNVLDDPNTQDDYFIREIFTSDFFDLSTDGSGPDAVCRYDHDYVTRIWFPCTAYENTWLWEWEMEWAYLVHLDEAHALNLTDTQWHSEDDLTFTPNSAWNDSITDLLPVDVNAGYWFFLGLSKSRQVRVIDPNNEPNGPFFDLYDPSGTDYGNQSLKIVRTADGRIFLPNYTETGGDYDEIKYLEPGRGYMLGFEDDDQVSAWPFCSGMSEEWIEPGSATKGGSGNSISSESETTQTEPVHFQFTARTQWWYPVMIDTIVIEGLTLESGDEIGVFDGNLCVGGETITGEFPLVIACWKDEITTPEVVDGYDPGNDMTFLYYDKSENTEITFVPPPMTMSKEEDDPVRPRHSGFGVGLYAIRSLVDGVLHVNQLPRHFELGQNYPNPFNAETVIPIILPERSQIKVELYDLLGRRVCQVYDGVQNAGQGRIHFNASNLSSGVYFYRVEAEGQEQGGKFSDIGKMLLLK